MDDLSIIIPVRRGDDDYKSLLAELLKINSQFEVFIIGPGLSAQYSRDPRVQFLESAEGRAIQQNLGALKSTKSHLWFLHADSVIDKNSLVTIKNSLKEKPDALFFFDLAFIKEKKSPLILNDLGAKFRSRILKMPFGDQGLFMSKKTFFKLGLFNKNAPYGEDHLLVWRAHQKSIEVLPCHVTLSTSARKYHTHGWLKTTAKHLFLTYKQAFPEWVECLRSRSKKNSSTAVAIFVKTPGVSVVKSRLAATIGVKSAEEFFHLSLNATKASVLEAVKDSTGHIEAYWAVAEKECLNHSLWRDFETISQGEGGLGDRLYTVYKELLKKHKAVILIGADLPHLNFNKLLESHCRLSTSEQFVMGKTDDGGFYLFGGAKPIIREVWSSVTYSAETTAEELIVKLSPSQFSFLEQDFDIDHEADLKRLQALDSSLLLPEQQAIIQWARKLGY